MNPREFFSGGGDLRSNEATACEEPPLFGGPGGFVNLFFSTVDICRAVLSTSGGFWLGG